MQENVKRDDGEVGAKAIGGVLPGYLEDLASSGAEQAVNILTLVLSDKDNMLLFLTLLLLPVSYEEVCQKYTDGRGSGG